MSTETQSHTLDEFEDLLNQCKLQVRHDPSGYLENPHLFDILSKVRLRLCHGSIPDHSLTLLENES